MMNFRSLNDLSFKLHFLLSPIGKTGPVRSDFPDQQSQFIFPVGKGQNDLRSQTLIERDLSFRPPGLALKPGAQTSARRYEIRGNLPGILPAVLRTALRGHAGRQPQRRQCLPNRRTAGRLIPDGRAVPPPDAPVHAKTGADPCHRKTPAEKRRQKAVTSSILFAPLFVFVVALVEFDLFRFLFLFFRIVLVFGVVQKFDLPLLGIFIIFRIEFPDVVLCNQTGVPVSLVGIGAFQCA